MIIMKPEDLASLLKANRHPNLSAYMIKSSSL